MIEHIATVRDRAITWDKREVVQHGLNSDTIRVDADSEFTNCDALALILCSASRPEPMRYMIDETLTVRIPSALMEQTGALSVCLIGYVGGAVRIVTKQERMPLVVVKSGETGGIDPDDDNPDLWGQLLAAEAARVEAERGREAAEALRVAAETARVAAETEREEDSAAAVKAANDAAATASKAAEKAKADTDAAIAKADAAEQARAGAETLRVEAENKRQQDTSTAIGNADEAASAANSAASTATSAAATAEQKGAAAQKIADNIKAAAERGDFNGAPGAPGDKGDPGTPGRDGTSPTANVQQTADGATVSITDKDGTTTATIRNGAKGDPGDKGDPGKDGTSPTASVKQTDTGATITVTDAHGTTTAEIANGRDAIPAAAILTGKTSGGIVNVTDAYPTALLGLSVYGKSVQDGTPSPDAPKDITNLNKAELVITGRNLVEQSTTSTNALNRFSSCLFVEADLMPSTNYVLSFNDVVGNVYYINEALFSNFHAFTTKSGRNVVKLSTKAEISKANTGQYVGLGWVILKNDKNQDKAPAFTDVQIELGDTATAYEPHQSTVTPIDLKGNELCSLPNGVKDEVVIDAEGNVSLIKRIGISPIPNSTSISDMASQTGKDGTFNYIVTLETLADAKIGNGMPCMCNKFTDGGISENRDTVRLGANDNHVYVYTSNEQLLGDKSLAHIDNWMKSNEVTIIYELAEPQITPLGKVELPALPEATSNVWNNGNIQTDVGITYVRDANIVIGRLEDKLARVAYGNL